MDSFKVDITGARRVGLRFEQFPDELYEALREEIEALTIELLERVKAATPDRTGRLRSQERMRLFADKDRITGYVDVAGARGSQDYAKAGALEYGAHRPTKVDAHNMRLDHYWATKLSAPETVLVSAYTRTPHIEEFSFERGPLAAMAPEITERLNEIVEAEAAKANA